MTDETMMDRVATAIATAETQWENSATLDSGWGWENQERNRVRFLARAAIEAMREPTEAMIKAGHAGGYDRPVGRVANIYSAMINRALE